MTPHLSTTDGIEAWYFAAPRFALALGSTYSIDPQLTLELGGPYIHASRRAIDALRFVSGPIVSRVVIWGDVQEGDDQLCGRYCKVLACADVTHELQQFACWCIRNTPIGGGRVVWDLLTQERSRDAVKTKERLLTCGASDDEVKAARNAAQAVVTECERKIDKDAAQAAWVTAWPWWSAAESAAEVARITSEIAEQEGLNVEHMHNDELERLLKVALCIKG